MREEDFLSRWSRRKREAKAETPSSEAAPPVETRDAQVPSSDPRELSGDEQGEPDIDLSSLPSIDSITAATDITAFLRKGIPQELTRAALRRAWSSDPVIRDFVGLAENAWDFNDPNAMPGFGPLDCSDAELSALVDRIVGGVRRVADNLTTGDALTQEAAQTAGSEREIDQQTRSTEVERDPSVRDQAVSAELPQSPAAPQKEIAGVLVALRRRKHGGALPGITDDGSSNAS
ncbi:hypothetical protein UNPF46_25680 [Bradyrhizobium sp. UNPF46]|uniref:DUF3306 domain-containing protein n=1 Tax=Bradyrhizobium sp. UNPF46 TaxID=1141168 RepID=UPI00114E1553|nr:DUF3306 domain-containing protein [Bradyrhizobium sp. UNPF46]TQF35222.1 hypothetical protein UNPF46_25680 [Bradyrhizobium sp. UNPF46]